MKEESQDIVQKFYNETPFPDYELERFKTTADVAVRAQPFSKILDRSIPVEASIIDVGTGTGMLSGYLALRRSNVWGIDFSDASLNKARALKEKLKLENWHLKKVNILDQEEITAIGEQFDYLLCLGVLHHTADPYQGFQNILSLVKPGGSVAIGLYNKPGRFLLKIRIFLAKTIFKNNTKVKDWFIRMQIGETDDKEKIRGWWNDQYEHPRESTHTVGEVLQWFKDNGITYSDSVPSLSWFNESEVDIAGVWNSVGEPYPNFFLRFWRQLLWIWTTHKEGGYWVMFGRKDN